MRWADALSAADGPFTRVGREFPARIKKFGGLGWYELWIFWGAFIHVGAVVTAWVMYMIVASCTYY